MKVIISEHGSGEYRNGGIEKFRGSKVCVKLRAIAEF